MAKATKPEANYHRGEGADRRKVGRPPRHAGEHLTKNRTFRIWGKLDNQLQAEALRAGRTVSAEIEYRLDQSFRCNMTDNIVTFPTQEATVADIAKNCWMTYQAFRDAGFNEEQAMQLLHWALTEIE